MKKQRLLFAGLLGTAVIMFSSCLTIHAKKIVEAPYLPPEEAYADAGEQEKNFKVYYSSSKSPVTTNYRVSGISWKILMVCLRFVQTILISIFLQTS